MNFFFNFRNSQEFFLLYYLLSGVPTHNVSGDRHWWHR